MSTYWYLECADHDPPILSLDEVTQHTDDKIDRVRQLWQNREAILNTDAVTEFADYFDNNALRFIRQHPKCAVQFRNEYGETQPIEVISEEP